MDAFEGFQKETIDFLWELRFNNNKEWFDQNRDRYQEILKKPMDQFSKEMALLLSGPDREMMGTVCRINRDIRFSKNKAPYKDHKWAAFRRTGTRSGFTPEFFFEISPDGYQYGMGYYDGKPSFMQRFRKKADANPAELLGLVQKFQQQQTFHLEGDRYKRKFESVHNEEVSIWYQKKNLAFVASFELDEVLFNKSILDKVKKDFLFLIPYYEYLYTLIE